MSSIDSAIIKTLTEHIKNNSGGGSAPAANTDLDMSMFEPINGVYEGESSWEVTDYFVTWSATSGGFNPTKFGDILRLQRTDGTYITAICTGKVEYEPYPGAPENEVYWGFQELMGGGINKDYRCDTNASLRIRIRVNGDVDQVLVPDNVNTGIFRLKFSEVSTMNGFIFTCLYYILRGM